MIRIFKSFRKAQCVLSSVYLLSLSGCYKHHLCVQQRTIDRHFLASTHVHTPDPKQKNPPSGQRFLVSWNFPEETFTEDLILEFTVWKWDNTQTVLICPITMRCGYEVFDFWNDHPAPHQKALTYRARALSKTGEVKGIWEHQFWTHKIDI